MKDALQKAIRACNPNARNSSEWANEYIQKIMEKQKKRNAEDAIESEPAYFVENTKPRAFLAARVAAIFSEKEQRLRCMIVANGLK